VPRLHRWLAFVPAVLLYAATAGAQSFPSKPVTIIVSVAPGGTLDTLARVIGGSLGPHVGQTVVVENVTGAGGLVGFQRLIKSEPDGHTLMFSNPSMELIPLLYPKAGIDAVADTTPVTQVATVPMVFSVSLKSGIADLPTLLERMRSGGFKPNLGSGGPGTTSHLAEALFLQLSRGTGELVQYRGSGPAITDLIAGTIDGVIDQTVTMLPLHREKRVRAIAVAAPSRLTQMPDVPTFAEGGMPEFDLTIWNGFFAPKGTSRGVVNTLSAAISKVLDSAEYAARLDQLAARVPPPAERGPDVFARIVQADQARYAAIAKAAGLQER
jgi:tripartite-type tricarboxylate transporter receptor subunit TctC